MNFLKKNKKIIAAFAAGVIITGGIGYAANEYLAGDIRYTKSGASSSISVAEALNELYQNKKEVSALNTIQTAVTQTTATANDIISGKKAYTQSGLITGSFNKRFVEGDKKYDVENNKLEVTNIGFTPRKVFLYSDSDKLFVNANANSSTAIAMAGAGGFSDINNWFTHECFTTLNNGFRFYNFGGGWESLTYHYIAIE